MENEPSWYAQLADWAARPPKPRQYRKAWGDKDSLRVWFCELWNEINDNRRKIAELEARIVELEGDITDDAQPVTIQVHYRCTECQRKIRAGKPVYIRALGSRDYICQDCARGDDDA